MAEVKKVTADMYGEGRGLDIAAGRDSDRWLVVDQLQTIWQEGTSRHYAERFLGAEPISVGFTVPPNELSQTLIPSPAHISPNNQVEMLKSEL